MTFSFKVLLNRKNAFLKYLPLHQLMPANTPIGIIDEEANLPARRRDKLKLTQK